MTSLLETRNEVLLDASVSISRNHMVRVGTQRSEMLSDKQKANVRYIIAELAHVVSCVENEGIVHGINDGNVNDFVDTYFQELRGKVKDVLEYDKRLINIDNLLYDNGYAVTNNTDVGDDQHRIYITQRHYFTC